MLYTRVHQYCNIVFEFRGVAPSLYQPLSGAYLHRALNFCCDHLHVAYLAAAVSCELFARDIDALI
jgi:hypothetical protein